MQMISGVTLLEIAVGVGPVAVLALGMLTRRPPRIVQPPLNSQALPITIQSAVRSNMVFNVCFLLFILVITGVIAAGLYVVSGAFGPFWARWPLAVPACWMAFWAGFVYMLARLVFRDYQNPETIVIGKTGISYSKFGKTQSWRWSEIDHAKMQLGYRSTGVRLVFKLMAPSTMSDPNLQNGFIDFYNNWQCGSVAVTDRDIVNAINEAITRR